MSDFKKTDLERKLIEAYKNDALFRTVVDHYAYSNDKEYGSFIEVIKDNPIEVLSQVYFVKNKEVNELRQELKDVMMNGVISPIADTRYYCDKGDDQ